MVLGKNLSLERSDNPTITLVDGEARRVTDATIDPTSLYVYASLKLQAPYGVRIYTYTVRVTEGPLKGAVIPLCDGNLPPDIGSPYQAFFRLDDGYSIREGPLTVELVRYWAK